MGSQLISMLASDIATGQGGLIFKGVINVPADFPTLIEVQVGWMYVIGTNVTDNDPTKTNTGQSFLAGDEIIWNGTNWTLIGSSAIWVDDGTDVKTALTPRNIDLQTGGLKDQFATTAVKFSDASNTSFNTTNKTVIGAVNEVKADIPISIVNSSNSSHPNFFAGLQINADGQTAFTISQAPINNQAFKLYLNGQLAIESVDYTLSGTTLTWIGTALVKPTIADGPDELTATINDTAGGSSNPTVYFLPHTNSNEQQFRTRSISGTGSWNFTFVIPPDFSSLVALNVIMSPTAGAAGSGKDVDLTSSYGGIGEINNTHSETDTTSTYDFGSASVFKAIDVSSVFSSLSAGDICGLNWDNNGVGGAIDVYAIQLTYTR